MQEERAELKKFGNLYAASMVGAQGGGSHLTAGIEFASLSRHASIPLPQVSGPGAASQ